jgi:Thioredoxin like C-terminal domain
VEAAADWERLGTPETYLGYGGNHFASPGGRTPDERRAYELPERLNSNHWALAGEWAIGHEKVVLDQADGRIVFRFQARDANLVLSSEMPGAIPFRVLLEGEPPGSSHGADVDEQGNGNLSEGRLYQLVRAQDEIRDRTLEITFHQPGSGRRRNPRAAPHEP